jgi:endoglucanase
MPIMKHRVVTFSLACAGALSLAGCAAETVPAEEGLGLEAESLDQALARNTRFYVPPPRAESVSHVVELVKARRYADAVRVAKMVATPRAVWLVGGSTAAVKKQVKDAIAGAKRARQVPVFVLYNVPFRDCAQYSSGGASDTAEYKEWIDTIVKSLGKTKAVVVVEPDGLGIIPYNTTIYGAEEWCKPTVPDADGNPVPAPGANPEERYAQLNYAVSELAANAKGALVYLDATHPAWLGVGEAAARLVRAGVAQARGFFLNVSNYESTEHSKTFGTWVSMCIAAGTAGPDWARGHFDWCASQYNPDLDYAVDYSPEYAETVSAGIQGLMGDAEATTSFVIDTGRNGQGPWTPATEYPDPQIWCNAPGRGVGLRPSANTSTPLVDAYLWLKVPGESDGSCNRGVAGSTTDPEWGGIVDPVAGAWFPEQAVELASLANPAL